MLVKKKLARKMSNGQLNSVNLESRLMLLDLYRVKLVSANGEHSIINTVRTVKFSSSIISKWICFKESEELIEFTYFCN